MKENLNKLQIVTDWDHTPIRGNYREDRIQKDFSLKNNHQISFDDSMVVFKNLEANLIDVIKTHKEGLIFGCVAWLTSLPILQALSECKNVQIILQKEDLWRPDLGSNMDFGWRSRIQSAYKALSFEHIRFVLNAPISDLSCCLDPTVEAVRCLGNYNKDKRPAFPRMHNKFLVFCEGTPKEYDSKGWYKPTAIWTGSFNFTENGSYSFENAIYLHDASGKNELINAYLKEHHQLFALSESLDWDCEWIQPEYRIGT